MHLYINQSRLHSNLQATYYIAFTELKTENDYSSWQAWSNQWPSRRYQRHSRTWIRRSQPASLFSNSTPLIQCSLGEVFNFWNTEEDFETIARHSQRFNQRFILWEHINGNLGFKQYSTAHISAQMIKNQMLQQWRSKTK